MVSEVSPRTYTHIHTYIHTYMTIQTDTYLHKHIYMIEYDERGCKQKQEAREKEEKQTGACEEGEQERRLCPRRKLCLTICVLCD